MAGHDTSKKNTDFVSYALARWASDLTYDKLSDEAIHSAKLYLFDSFGCALGGSQQHDVRIALDHFKQMGGAKGYGEGQVCIDGDPGTAGLNGTTATPGAAGASGAVGPACP